MNDEPKENEARPINSAPKNGRILLFLEDCDWVIGSWNPKAFDGPRWEDDGLETCPFIIQPTHWMPLPNPPTLLQSANNEKQTPKH